MGQYYKPVLLSEKKESYQPEDIKGWLYSHAHKTRYTRDDGTSFVSGHGLKLMEHSYIGNGFVGSLERRLLENPTHLVWAGDYADNEPNYKVENEDEEMGNLFGMSEHATELKPKMRKLGKKWRYIVNHTKGEFVDKEACPFIPDWEGAKIHPLPLLTAEGNNRGGGDFRNENQFHYVGRWSRDLISIESKKPKNFEEIKPDFQE